MTGRGSVGRSARLLCAAAILPFVPAPALAQAAAAHSQPDTPPRHSPPPDAAEFDPSASLAPMPDLDVELPDRNTRDQAPPARPQTKAAIALDAGGSEIRYVW